MKYENPWMSDSEIQTITKYLKKDDTMLEWGSGGSTNYFPQFVKEYYSIEHDQNWFNEISQSIPNNVNYNFVDLDQPLTDPTQKQQLQTYINFVDTLGLKKIDKVLIDGRGRGWCAEKVIPYLTEDSVVFLHDYWQRPSYHIVEQWFDIIDYVKDGQSLVVLKLKKHLIQNKINQPMKISIIQPTRNNLKYLTWAYDAIRKNQGEHIVEICVADDFSNDRTWEWCETKMKEDKHFKAIRHDGPTRLGHTILYDKLVNEVASHDICMIYHADMYLCPEALTEIQKYIGSKKIVSLTRIEPPLHPDGPEKILADWGVEPEDFNEEKFLEWFTDRYKPKHDQPTAGIFAPWAFMKADFQEINGHDPLYAPQSKEDSDIFNRFLLNGINFIQTWKGCVYHMTCRGSRFNPTLTTPGTSSSEWEAQNIRSSRNFTRKWGHFVKHDPLMMPIIPHKYNIAFAIKNSTFQHLEILEPWCDRIYLDDEMQIIIDNYIQNEQPNTKFDLKKRIFTTKYNDPFSENDIILEFDGRNFTQNSFNIIQNLSDIITESGEIGTFELDCFKITINSMEIYEKNLIYLKN